MGARSIARVVISFGMTNIGVKLYLAASAEQIGFNMINPKTGNRISQKLVDKETGDEVQRGDTLKGYEYAKDKFITFTEEEVANMQAEKRDTLDIKEFIPLSEIDPLHVEKTMYTGPDKGFDKAYTLLYQTLLTENKAAVGTWVSRGKEHLVVIRAYQHGLIMHQMFYDTEVRTFENTCSKVTLSPIETAMGKMLITQFSVEKFDKSKYSDKFIEKLNKAVETKLNGQEISAKEAPVNMSSMADALRESLLAMGVSAAQIDAMIAKAQGQAAPAPVVAPIETKPEVPEVKAGRGRKKAANG